MSESTPETAVTDALSGAEGDAVSTSGEQQSHEGIDLRSLGESLRSGPLTLPVADAAAQQVEAQPTGTEGDEGDDGEADTSGEPTPDAASPHSSDEWAAILAETPQRLTEIPSKLRVEVLRLALSKERSVQASIRDAAFAAGQRAASQEADLRANVAQIDELRQSDPTSFVQWQEQYPQRFEGYVQAKAHLASLQRASTTATASSETIISASAQVMSRLDQYPEAIDRIKAKAAANPYMATAEGLARLTGDVTDELVAARTAAQQAADSPARAKAAQRAEGVDGQAAKPKVITPTGGGVGALTAAMIKSMSPEELMKIPDWRAKVDAALAS